MTTQVNSRIDTGEQLFTRYYLRCFPTVAKLVKRGGGSLDDAKDVFQDALVAMVELQGSERLGQINDQERYLAGVARNLWHKRVERDKHRKASRLKEEPPAASETEVQPTETRLYRLLVQSGPRCMELLSGFYFERLHPRELATRFGFSGERSATVQKHKCLEKLRFKVQQHNLEKEDFYD